ncbi:MAG: FtsX-like permease family protein [Acidimicrobiia bacterium]|nr:FtsX-like permease family protein [Acidimicrobiia bacterium]
MLRVSLKGVWAHKIRLVLTALAILLGVGLITGVYIYTDTIRKGFDQIFVEAYANTDIAISSETETGPVGGLERYLDEGLVAEVDAIEGVAQVFPFIQGQGVDVLDNEGEVIGSGFGPPTFVANLDAPKSIDAVNRDWFELAEGTYPMGWDEMALDRATANLGGFTVGSTVSILSNLLGPMEKTLTGVVTFRGDDTIGGTGWVLFDLATAQEMLGRQDKISGASIQVDAGMVVDEVIPSIESVLPEDAVARSGQDAAEADAADIQTALSFFTVFLSAFGWIALFVGSFLIYNTFRIVVSQRSRELALLRALGASSRQVLSIVLLEAALIGAIGAVLGLGFGVAIALLIQTALPALGIELPEAGLTILPRTVIVGLAAGLVITLLSAIIPARRASKVEVMSALRDDPAGPAGARNLRRIITGLTVFLLGLAALLFGLFGDTGSGPSPVVYVGIGIGVIFIAMFILSPLIAQPVTNIIGWALERFSGIPGRLARRNAQRSPDRSAATAAAVMISITLVALAATLTGSIRGTINDIISNDVVADVTVQPSGLNDPTTSFAPVVARNLADLDIVEDLSRLQIGFVRLLVDGGPEEAWTDSFAGGVEPNLAEFAIPESVEGTLKPESGEVILDPANAEAAGVSIGDTVVLEFQETGRQSFTLVGIAGGAAWAGTIGIARDDWIANYGVEQDSAVYIKAVDGVSAEELKAVVEQEIAEYPNLAANTIEDLQTQAESQLNGLLNFILALLALAVGIGMLGVTNTMALSVFERTREIGLLRAVGMNRRTTRWMVRLEASIVSMFGAVLGIGLGIFFGWALIRALEDLGLSVFLIPWLPSSLTISGVLGSLLFWLFATGILGVAFAVYPARRAARMKVIEAIAHL